jgi:hypothetical protein
MLARVASPCMNPLHVPCDLRRGACRVQYNVPSVGAISCRRRNFLPTSEISGDKHLPMGLGVRDRGRGSNSTLIMNLSERRVSSGRLKILLRRCSVTQTATVITRRGLSGVWRLTERGPDAYVRGQSVLPRTTLRVSNQGASASYSNRNQPCAIPRA